MEFYVTGKRTQPQGATIDSTGRNFESVLLFRCNPTDFVLFVFAPKTASGKKMDLLHAPQQGVIVAARQLANAFHEGQPMRSVFIASILPALLLVSSASGAILQGDFVFLNDSISGQPAAVLQADRTTGNRTIVSQFGVRGTGPDFDYSIGGIDVSPSGDIYVSGNSGTSIFKIDPVNGNRTVISSFVVGSGPTFSGEGDLVIGPSGDIFVARDQSIVGVSPITGNRTVISGPSRGNGQQLQHVTGLTVTQSGNFFAFETSASSPDDDLVFFVDGATGNRTIVSGGNIGSGPAFNHFGFDVELLLDGDLAVVDHANRILRVNATTGARSILSGPGVGGGPNLGGPGIDGVEWLTLDSAGFLIAARPSGPIFRVDPANGNRSIITSSGFGTGPALLNREAVEYNIVAEPSSVLLTGLGLVVFVGWSSLRKSR